MVDPVYTLHRRVRARAVEELRQERRRKRRVVVLSAALAIVGIATSTLLVVHAGLPLLRESAVPVAQPPPTQASPEVQPIQASSAKKPEAPLQPAEPAGGPPLAAAGAPAAAVVVPAAGGAVQERTPTVRITATGDIAPGSTPMLPPDGGAELFRGVSSLLEGDVVVANLEAALTDRTSSKCPPDSTSCYAFLVPPSYADPLADAGFTVLNIANNHSFDAGDEGALDTVRALAGQGVATTGLTGQIAYADAGGIRVAVVGFAPYGWGNNLLDLATATALVRDADERADVVVVAMHAGAEGSDAIHVERGMESFLGENRGDPVLFAHAVVDAGADLVVGTGPHVLRGLEWYGGRLIAYSLGSFAGYRTLSIEGVLGVSAVLNVELNADGSWAGGDLAPVRLVGNGTPEPDPEGSALRLVDELSHEDFGDAAVRVSPGGSLEPPAGP